MIRRISVAAALTAALVMSGCGSDQPAGDPTGAPTSASPTPTHTATGPVAPVLPEAAKVNDDAGARAFVEYWFAAVTYAMQTGDTKPFMAVSAEECKTCAGLVTKVRKIYDQGGHLSGGGWIATGLRGDGKYGRGQRIFVFVEQARQELIGSDGNRVSTTRRTGFGAQLLIEFGGAWQLREMARL